MKTVALVWQTDSVEGDLRVAHGRLASLRVADGEGRADGARFTLGPGARLEAAIDQGNTSASAFPTLVTVATQGHTFTFLLRDVDARAPIWIPAYGAAVTEASDPRGCAEIAATLRARHTQTALQHLASEPEESYAHASADTRRLQVPTWLGLSRDMRNFEIEVGRESRSFVVSARYHGAGVTLPGVTDPTPTFRFWYGRGPGCVEAVAERRLEEGVLPILRGRVDDGDVQYHFTTFVTLERSPLAAETVRGTHFLVANGYGYGAMLTEEQRARFDALQPQELDREEETVLYYRVQAVNTGQVPRYAWFQAPHQTSSKDPFDGARGFRMTRDGAVSCLVTLEGAPLPKPEVARLVPPGETLTWEFRIPHRPISAERAEALAAQDFAHRHAECCAYWRAKLATSAQFAVPETRVREMIDAGKLHLDLIAYGLEPDGTVVPCIGGYNAIGSESAPIIQYYDSLGWHDLARRSLQFFLDTQHDDGFMQNFGDYMLETGAALWSMGEHFRYTRDTEWVRGIAPKLLKSCDYLLAWRERNKDVPRGGGHGLMEGKVADPEDPYHTFMLNGYAYLGLARVAEMLAGTDPAQSARLTAEAEALKQDLREELRLNLAKSPVVPLGDGSWCPTAGPWAEARGPVGLLLDDQPAFYGTFLVRDMIGPLYLVFQEVLSPDEPAATWMLEYSADLFHMRNVALGQPYYSPHAYVHLRRGEVKAFLAQFYHGFAGLADRETYSFWETYMHASAHKTHEEAWFLLQTRWMLYLEEGDTLLLLPGIPRAWLAHGQEIAVTNAATYFGPLSFRVVSEVEQGRITATIDCATDRKPTTVTLRLPHPDGLRAARVTGGTYDPAAETIRVDGFTGHAQVVADYQ